MHYASDLAYIHDQGFGGFAHDSAPGLLLQLHQSGISDGLVVDVGCGSGIWARQLVDAGYKVTGIDISPAMIEIARQRVPEAEFQVGSFLQVPLPACRAVTAIGEVFNYLFDAEPSLEALGAFLRRVFDALAPHGLLIFDVAEPGRCRGQKQAFFEGDDWTCLVDFRYDESDHRVSRRIVTFRKIGDSYRRHEETHTQQLLEEASIVAMLAEIGFRVRTMRSYGERPLANGVVAFVAMKP